MRGWKTHSRFLAVTTRDEGAGVFPSRSGTPLCVFWLKHRLPAGCIVCGVYSIGTLGKHRSCWHLSLCAGVGSLIQGRGYLFTLTLSRSQWKLQTSDQNTAKTGPESSASLAKKHKFPKYLTCRLPLYNDGKK